MSFLEIKSSEFAAELGCPYHSAGIDVAALIDSCPDVHSIRSNMFFLQYVFLEVDQQFRLLPPLIRGADLVIGASLCFALATLAESMRIPYRFIAFTPQVLLSREHPFVAFKRHGLPGRLNLFGWHAVRIVDHRFGIAQRINRWRIRLGLKPIADTMSHLLGDRVIVATDPAITAIPLDAASHAFQFGYLHLYPPAVDLPELDAFLEAGPAPIYAGFGSMPRSDQIQLTSRIIQAARSTGHRLVIGRFWQNECGRSKAGDVFFIHRYPHHCLFPKMAAVIHHGGAGTTATAAMSGVPQIIVPHILDQFYWGDRIFRCGLGSRAIWRSHLTEKKLGHAITSCLNNPQMKQRAETVAEKIRQTHPVQRVVHEISRYDEAGANLVFAPAPR